MFSKIYYIFTIFSIIESISTKLIAEKPILIVISLPGFRLDYLKFTPDLRKLRENGKFIQKITDLFPTLENPAHHTIATGEYPEIHGVMGNSLFDSESKKLIESSEELFMYNKTIKPIYILNELNGGISGCNCWVGCEFKYNKVGTTYYSNEQDTNLRKEIDKTILWLLNQEKPANFIMISFQQAYTAALNYGTQSKETGIAIKKINDAIKYLFIKLNENQLNDRTNLVVFSPYGMIDVPRRNYISLNYYINETSYKRYGDSTVSQIVPIRDSENLYEILKKNERNFRVYKMDTIPKRWHCNSPRFKEIVLVANPSYSFWDKNERLTLSKDGYDSQLENKMYGFLIAKGSNIDLISSEYMAIVDIYKLFYKILQIEDSKLVTRIKGSMTKEIYSTKEIFHKTTENNLNSKTRLKRDTDSGTSTSTLTLTVASTLSSISLTTSNSTLIEKRNFEISDDENHDVDDDYVGLFSTDQNCSYLGYNGDTICDESEEGLGKLESLNNDGRKAGVKLELAVVGVVILCIIVEMALLYTFCNKWRN